MSRVYDNNYSGTVATASVGTGDTSIDVGSAPSVLAAGEYYIATLTDSLSAPTKTEIIKITGISSNTMTIERAQEGTAAQTWDNTSLIEIRVTAGSFETLDGPELKRYNETVHAATNALDRADGGIQTYTMSVNTTFTAAIADGESITLHLSGGNTYTATWPAITWMGGSEPTLSANDVIQLWKVGGTLYGAHVGEYA